MEKLTLVPRKMFRAALMVILALLFLDLLSRGLYSRQHSPFAATMKAMFDLDLEHNVPAFFSFLQLLFASMVLGLMAAISGRRMDRQGRALGGLALIFLYLAIDELEMIHERSGDYVRSLLHTGGAFYYAWIIPAGMIVLVIGALYLPFLLSLPVKTRNGILLAGSAFVFFTIGGDMVFGSIVTYFPESIGHHSITIENLVEEGGEMVSIAYFIRVLLEHVRDNMAGLIYLRLTVKSMDKSLGSVGKPAPARILTLPRTTQKKLRQVGK